jgi:hypothetical protein
MKKKVTFFTEGSIDILGVPTEFSFSQVEDWTDWIADSDTDPNDIYYRDGVFDPYDKSSAAYGCWEAMAQSDDCLPALRQLDRGPGKTNFKIRIETLKNEAD